MENVILKISPGEWNAVVGFRSTFYQHKGFRKGKVPPSIVQFNLQDEKCRKKSCLECMDSLCLSNKIEPYSYRACCNAMEQNKN